MRAIRRTCTRSWPAERRITYATVSSLLGLRLAYAFTPRVYLQSLLQYNDQTRRFSSNIRFGWLGSAGSGLFIVFNDIERVDLFDRRAVERGPLERGLIVKYSRRFDLAF